MPVSHRPEDLAALGRQWVEAWNSRDLERVLTLYAEEAEMTSDRIPALGFDASGTVRGKASLRLLEQAADVDPEPALRADRYVCEPRQRRGVLPERAR